MNRRIVTILVCFFASVWLLAPNFLTQDSPMARFFSGQRLNLGLDLKGGIHIVLGVDVQRALDVEFDKYIVTLQTRAEDKGQSFGEIQHLSSERAALLKFKTEQELSSFEKFLRDEFFGVLVSAGGDRTSLRLQLDTVHAENLVKMSLEQAREIIRNRVDEFGVAEPVIQIQGEDRIVVQLPGVQDPERAIQLIGKTALLEFKIVDESLNVPQLEALIDRVRVETGFKNNFTRSDLERLNKALAKDLPAGTQVSFERETDGKSGEAVLRPYLLKSATVLTGQALEDAMVTADQTTQFPQVSLRFSKAGAESFEKITEQSVGKLLAIVLDGVVMSAPVIKERIPAISAGATISLGRGNPQKMQKEARDLALVLRSGALPAPVEVLENRTVGASLGDDSIKSGQLAALLGAILVIVFMLVYYRWSGFLADITLILNILMLLSFMALFQATLTLPGIAGIVLTIGMAVDANVIILERIREELLSGKKVRSAIEAGYSGAHTAIFDSNLTTLISGLVLYNLGTGPIKGFAVTLMIGLIINYICAVWFSRWIYEWYLDRHSVHELSI